MHYSILGILTTAQVLERDTIYKVHVAGIELSKGIYTPVSMILPEQFFIATIRMFSADFEHMTGVVSAKIKKKCKNFYGICEKAAS